MNSSYTYINGKAIIFDENGNQVPINYYNNLDDVLVQENVVETIENKIKELGDIKILPKKKFIPFTTICITIGILIAPLILSLIFGINMYTTCVNTAFGEMNLFKIIAIICGVTTEPVAVITDILNHSIYNDPIKHNNAKVSELEFLKRKLVEEKEKLNTLKKQSIETEKKEDFKIVKVDDIEELKQLKNMLLLYYDLGFNPKKYYKLQQQGKLKERLAKKYSENEIKLVEQYLEEKGPTLVKKLTN